MSYPRMLLQAVFLQLLLFCDFALTAKRTPTLLIFTDVKTKFNSDYLSDYTVEIVPHQPGITLNMDMYIKRNYTHDMMMRIDVLVLRPKSNEYRSIFSFDFDFCKIFSGSDKHKTVLQINASNMLDVWTTLVRRYANMPTCPVMAGHYGINQLKADKRSVPPFVPSGKYRVDVSNYLKDMEPKVHLNNVSVFIDIRKK